MRGGWEGGTWPNDHQADPDTGLCLLSLRVLQNKAQRRKNVSLGGQNKVCSHGWVHVKAWKGGKGHGQGIFQVWGKESKCERDTTQGSDGQTTDKRVSKKKSR